MVSFFFALLLLPYKTVINEKLKHFIIIIILSGNYSTYSIRKRRVQDPGSGAVHLG